MSDPVIAVFMLGLFIFMVMLGFPIAFTLIAMGLGFGYYAYYDAERMQTIFDNRIFDLFVQNTFSVMSNDVLVAVPLFLFMGYVVERANIVNRLFFSIQLAARHLPGSMAVAALFTCAIFATASGIIGAVVTLMGMLAFPAMLKANYDESFAAGVICAGGCLGILIPPSIMLIVYSAIAEISPLRLYAAAMFPGLLLAGLYMVYVVSEPGAKTRRGRCAVIRQDCLGTDNLVYSPGAIDHECTRCHFNGPGDAGRSGGCRRVRGALPGAVLSLTQLGAFKTGGLPHCQDFGDGVLAVRRLLDLCLGVLLPRRSRADQRVGTVTGPGIGWIPDTRAIDYLPAGLAA
jgi:TRAP-type mannitol/chloroaromatic compound transport system permease large subunit